MTTSQRNYKNKDVDMLITVSTLIENAIANKAFLQDKRSTWADPFFDHLKQRIENAIQTYLGVDSAKDLREATIAVLSIQQKAISQLADLKVQITEDFRSNKPRRDEILNQLGFTSYLKEVQKKDQKALINLLYQYKTNLTTSLKTEIITEGTAETLLDDILSFADSLKTADISQETLKSSRKTITATAVKEFNDIYDQVISICKIASKFYKDQPAMKEQFSYSKVGNVLKTKSNADKTPPPAPIA